MSVLGGGGARWAITALVLLGLAGVVGWQALKWYYPFPYRETIERHAGEHRIDPLLVAAVMRVESGFNPRAVSAKGARGLMQLMPETAEWVAQQMGLEPFALDMLFDPEVNVALGVWYLADLWRLFDGNTVLVLAAYNGGRGNVRRWMNEGEWTGTIDELSEIPFPETRAFVRKVLSAYTIYRRLWGSRATLDLAL